MSDTVVDIPDNYDETDTINDVLAQIEELDFDGQISVLRTIDAQIGYSDVKAIPTQAEIGKTPNL